MAGEVGLGGGVEAGGEGIGPGVAAGGVGAPAGGVVPAVAVAGGVGMDGDDDDVVLAELAAPGIDTAAALGQGDVPFLQDKEFGVEAEGEEAVHDAGGNEAVLGVFRSTPSGERLPGVLMPWPLSMRIFIDGFSFRFLIVSYEKSVRKAMLITFRLI